MLEAKVKKCHLRANDEARFNIPARVRRFVESLGRVKGGVKGTRDSDEVGHIIGDLLGGPHDCLYNFFPQSPHCNMEYYHKVEKAIYDYLMQQNSDEAYVEVIVRLVYIDYMTDLSPNRPWKIKVLLRFSNGQTVELIISNA